MARKVKAREKFGFLDGALDSNLVIGAALGLLFGVMFSQAVAGLFLGVILAIAYSKLSKKKGKESDFHARIADPQARYKRMIGFGVAALTIGMLLNFLANLDRMVITVLIAVGSALLMAGAAMYVLARLNGGIVSDERTRKVHNAAMSYSWWVAYAFLAGVYWVTYYKAASITIDGLISLTFFVMIASYLVAKRILESRGDSV